MIKKILKSPTSKMAAKFTGGNIIVALIGAASAIVYGRWIGPEILGEFNKYGILTGYLTVGIIFVDAAFQRHFPYYLGKNQEKKSTRNSSCGTLVVFNFVFIGRSHLCYFSFVQPFY